MITFKALEVPGVFRDRTLLRSWLQEVTRSHGHSINELNYVLVSDPALLEYNKRYLDHDEFTDVITFDGQTGKGLSGDVLMSYDRIKENATTYGTSIGNELNRVMVHGLLHLLGHKDRTKEQKKTMREMEDKFLDLLSTMKKNKGHRR
jgi:probable rRNA maturation factor